MQQKGTYKHLRTGLKDGHKRIKPNTYIGSNVKKLSNKRMPRRNVNHDKRNQRTGTGVEGCVRKNAVRTYLHEAIF
jgi:hypothetical protein